MTEQGETGANMAQLCNSRAWADALRKGAACLSMGQPDQAKACFQDAAELRPADARAQRLLGAAFLKAGDPVGAAKMFDRACQARPTDPGSLQGLGLALHALGIRGAALDVFRRSAAAGGGWTAWQSIADITENETERIQAIDHAADSLGCFCETSKADALHFAQCMNALLSAHRIDAAKRFARANLCRFPNRSAGYNALARAHYCAGAYRQAFAYKARALLHLTNSSSKDTQGPPPFEPSRAALAFQALSKSLEKAGIPHCLVGGTLLGVRRSGEPLAHDRDLDIAILRRSDGSPDVAAFLRNHPDILFPRISRPGDRYFGVHFRGVGVDFFVYDERDGALVCGLSNVPGDIQWRFSRFGICWKSYGAFHWPVPSDPDLYLSETYGAGWQAPDKNFSSAVSSPALHQTAPYARAYYAAARAGRALQSGHRARADTMSGSGPSERAHVLVKPVAAGLSTNLMIATDRRTYHLELTSLEKSYMAALSWRYPSDALAGITLRNERALAREDASIAAGVQIDSLNFAYRIEGAKPAWRPVRVFDDGRQVFIQMPDGLAALDAPPLFVLAGKNTELVNYRVKGNYYIVDHLFTAAELRQGNTPQTIVRISRTAPRPGEGQ